MAQQGIENIVRLLKDDHDTTKAYACVTLTNMASDELMRQEVASNAFIPSLYVALCSKLVFFFIIFFLNSTICFAHFKERHYTRKSMSDSCFILYRFCD